MTHLAWVPEGWEEQARSALGGMAERHPSRTILLFPAPDAGVDQLDADVSVERYAIPGVDRDVCSEVVELRLNGKRAKAPASIVEPLLISDLPVFLRWRGEPAWESQELEQLVRHRRPHDRRLDRVGRPAVSVHAALRSCSTARRSPTSRGRGRRAGARSSRRSGPTSRTSERFACTERRRRRTCSPAGCARASTGRTSRSSTSTRSASKASTSTASRSAFPPGDPPLPSDVLSDELDRFTRDPVYEAAVSSDHAIARAPRRARAPFVETSCSSGLAPPPSGEPARPPASSTTIATAA